MNLVNYPLNDATRWFFVPIIDACSLNLGDSILQKLIKLVLCTVIMIRLWCFKYFYSMNKVFLRRKVVCKRKRDKLAFLCQRSTYTMVKVQRAFWKNHRSPYDIFLLNWQKSNHLQIKEGLQMFFVFVEVIGF